jgi:hypothetical protein
MALRTRICDLLGIEYPILLAGMGRTSTPELAATVSNAGGLGVIGAASCGPNQLRAWIRRGIVNLPAMRPPRGHTKGDAQQSSGCDGNPADIRPHLERTHPCGTILDGGDVVAAEVEEVGDLVVGGEETLCLSR